MLKVGITGNIASGKSQVEKIISDYGYRVFDLDKTTHSLFENSEILKNKLKLEFDTFERSEVSKIVFDDKNKLKTLENIIHPMIKDEMFKIFDENKGQDKIFVSGALLFESGFSKFFDKTIFVEADTKLRLERLMKRNNLSETEALKRINSQQNNKHLADILIQNNGTIDELKQRVKEALKLL